MSTAQDLAIIALSASDREVGQGDLSLALAGAEVLDLVEAQVIGLDGERLVPGTGSAADDRLLGEAASSVVRQEPYEAVEDWLWRRGRELSAAYTDELERAGLVNRTRGNRLLSRPERVALVDSPAVRRAEERRASGEPVLAALAAAVGLDDRADDKGEEGDDEGQDVGKDLDAGHDLTDDATVTVLAAVGNAVMELEAVRQRRSVENAAFDNVWRGF
ncbi:GPP34 family phosphoprotein [Streptomyces sp. NPDC050400]|uniref:GPP34 family phosphoprotein n=1 Tax=Streptomyces sp. NPDC050400 TaxID=3365610 RepID=UPI0037AAC52B